MKPSPVPANASVGIVLATHGSLPYLRLHLECLKKHEPNVRVLIHDDSSEQEAELRALAKDYGAFFVSTPYRLAPTVGDLSAFVEGLRWGEREGLDVVVKCSRRFVIDKPWSVGLVELMHNTGYATATAPCAHFSFGFRSELTAFHVKSWIDAGAMDQMAGAVAANVLYSSLPEAYYHERAREVHRFIHPIASCIADTSNPQCDYLLRSEQFYARSTQYDGYAIWWNVLGLSRMNIVPNVYWHDIHTPNDMAELAMRYGLPYTPIDFFTVTGE
jgi:hypothetical protein